MVGSAAINQGPSANLKHTYFFLPNQQSSMLNLRIQACMSDTLAPDQHSYLL